MIISNRWRWAGYGRRRRRRVRAVRASRRRRELRHQSRDDEEQGGRNAVDPGGGHDGWLAEGAY
jgi:hypothetical protein